ncbi:MAG: hypothetical protein SBU_000311 [Candidatus Syntrophoarchaeum butanivorans]|uniref:DUF5402 family protein n=2 Tax=Candidatus Syntropharchaeum butanivorans TaxID=1839936 RepID=A0A1F2P718_9EURY|nr:MAG: hypothetical protein SBU_000311 [Candidatus Syntrophoarchaeum butanivorans]RJS71680.1 MAG: hypothetical protein CW694_04745 [Candidatus Syntrophoarchaeum sp. WYZ-LMO15]
MKLPAKLLEWRASIEKELGRLTGRTVWVVQLSASSFACGCTGITIFTAGLEMEEVEIFAPKITPTLREAAAELELDPEIIYASTIPGTSEVGSISLRDLCDECREDYMGVEEALPWSNTHILFIREKT